MRKVIVVLSIVLALSTIVAPVDAVAFPDGYNPPADLRERLEALMPLIGIKVEQGVVIQVGETFKPGLVAYYSVPWTLEARIWTLEEWIHDGTIANPVSKIRADRFHYIQWRFVESLNGTVRVFRTEQHYTGNIVEFVEIEKPVELNAETLEVARTIWATLEKAGVRM